MFVLALFCFGVVMSWWFDLCLVFVVLGLFNSTPFFDFRVCRVCLRDWLFV